MFKVRVDRHAFGQNLELFEAVKFHIVRFNNLDKNSFSRERAGEIRDKLDYDIPFYVDGPMSEVLEKELHRIYSIIDKSMIEYDM